MPDDDLTPEKPLERMSTAELLEESARIQERAAAVPRGGGGTSDAHPADDCPTRERAT